MKLPLFPLDTVLFPGCLLDLQLFEARYLDMLSGCMKRGEGAAFRAVLQRPRGTDRMSGQPQRHALGRRVGDAQPAQ